MTILVTGASGLVGSAIVAQAAASGRDVLALAGGRPDLVPPAPGVAIRSFDLDAPDAFRHVLSGVRAEAVIHAAAMTDVNACEKFPELAFRRNAWATARMAEACAAAGVPFLFLSSHAVFDGRTGGETEDQAPAPRNAYAMSKAAGEEAVIARGGTVVRIMPVGVQPLRPNGATFGEWLTSTLRAGKDLKLFRDVRLNPTTPARCAHFLLHVAGRSPPSAILHLGSQDVVSKADLGLALLDRLPHYPGKVEVVSLAGMDVGATRPRETWVDTRRTAEAAGYPMPPSREVVESLASSLSAPLRVIP